MKRSDQAREIVTNVCTYIIYYCERMSYCLQAPKYTCEVYLRVYVFAEIMYEITSLTDLHHAFLGHYNLFQTIEKYKTPEQTSQTLQKIIEWLKELIQLNEYEPETISEIFICYEGQKVQVVS